MLEFADDDLWVRRESGLLVPNVRERQLRAVDLFSGCGGFSLGMQQAGIDVVGAVELEPAAIMTYLGNLGSTWGSALCFVTEDDKSRFYRFLKKQGETQTSGWVGRNNQASDGSGCRAMVVGDATQVTGDWSFVAAPGREPTRMRQPGARREQPSDDLSDGAGADDAQMGLFDA